jgi:hypothetical protein
MIRFIHFSRKEMRKLYGGVSSLAVHGVRVDSRRPLPTVVFEVTISYV